MNSMPQGEIVFEEWHLHKANTPSTPWIYSSYDLAIQDMQQLIAAFVPCYLEKNITVKKVMGVYHTTGMIPVTPVTNNFANVGQNGVFRVATPI